MTTTPPRRLPRGRSALPREEVTRAQRERLLTAMADAMRERGYADTSVGEVLKRAGISRQTFYELFSSKAECFLAAFDEAARLLEEVLEQAMAGADDPLDRFERAVAAYVEILAIEPGYARLFVVEVNAAGPEAIARRAEFQDRLTSRLAEVLKAEDDTGFFACRTVVAAMSSMVTIPLVTGDADELRELGSRVIAHVRALKEHGVF